MRLSLRHLRRKGDTVRYHDIFPTPPVRRTFVRKPRVLIAAGLFLALAASGALVYRHTLRADTLTLYPTACLGGWKNPERAQGPLSGDAASAAAVPTDSAAILPENTLAEVYCGGFSADIPSHTTPKSLTLLVAWSTEHNDTPVVSGNDFASSSGQVLDAPPGTDPSFQLIEPAPGDEPAPSAPSPASTEAPPVPEPAPASEPSPEPVPDAGPVSFLRRLVRIAHAQEAETAPSVPEPSAVDTPSGPSALPAPAPDAMGSGTQATDTPPVPTVSDNGFLEVRYTLNGKDWQSLGTFDAAHIVPTTFSIPLPENASWSDLSSFQISIRSNALIDGTPPVYLDGMELRINYDKELPRFYADKDVYGTEDTIVLTSEVPGSYVQIYWLDNPDTAPEASQVYAAVVGDDGTVQLEANTLFPGRFKFVNTTTRWHCSNLYLEDCLKHGPLGDALITIVTKEQLAAMASTTVPIASTTTADGEASTTSEGTSTPEVSAPPASAEQSPEPAPSVGAAQTQP